MFGSLLERPLIAAEAQSRYPVLIKMFDNELECCRKVLKSQMQMEEAHGEIFIFIINKLHQQCFSESTACYVCY